MNESEEIPTFHGPWFEGWNIQDVERLAILAWMAWAKLTVTYKCDEWLTNEMFEHLTKMGFNKEVKIENVVLG